MVKTSMDVPAMKCYHKNTGREKFMINREDMLELTRRMTPSRTSFTRVAGGYMEPGGEIDESF